MPTLACGQRILVVKRLRLSDGDGYFSGWAVINLYEKGLEPCSRAFGITWFVKTILGRCGILG